MYQLHEEVQDWPEKKPYSYYRSFYCNFKCVFKGLIKPFVAAAEMFPQQEREPCSRLGSDLLQMYLQQIDADITVRSESGDLRAHKYILLLLSCSPGSFSKFFCRCILAATSTYFKSLLAASPPGTSTIELKYCFVLV